MFEKTKTNNKLTKGTAMDKVFAKQFGVDISADQIVGNGGKGANFGRELLKVKVFAEQF